MARNKKLTSNHPDVFVGSMLIIISALQISLTVMHSFVVLYGYLGTHIPVRNQFDQDAPFDINML